MSLLPQFGQIIPSQSPQLLATNYLQWNNNGGAAGIPGNFADFAQQYLPEIYEAEVERYGNRTLSGFLKMVGAEMPMTSDQVIWSEQNRLHISYIGCTLGAIVGTTQVINLSPGVATAQNVISVNDTVVVLDPATGLEAKGIVTATTIGVGGSITVQSFQGPALNGAGNLGFSAAGLKVFVYGSDYSKGTTIAAVGAGNSAVRQSIDPVLTQFSNSPIIIRDQYVVSGSDTAQIGWVNVATEDGTDGYLWYLKAESETRLRFEDYLEMSMVEGELNTSALNPLTQPGTQGLFAAIQARGNVETGFTAAQGLGEFDAILKNLDTQGAIEENMLFLQRQTSLDFDDMLASISSGVQGGVAFGLFENSSEMALNLGFSGFRRGSYDFYKTDWKYLNDPTMRGDIVGGSVNGILVPAGSTTVYDQVLGKNAKRPFLHVRYRASETEDRKYKTWITGSAGGASTSSLDAMEVNFLSERALCTLGANNFFIFK